MKFQLRRVLYVPARLSPHKRRRRRPTRGTASRCWRSRSRAGRTGRSTSRSSTASRRPTRSTRCARSRRATRATSCGCSMGTDLLAGFDAVEGARGDPEARPDRGLPPRAVRRGPAWRFRKLRVSPIACRFSTPDRLESPRRRSGTTSRPARASGDGFRGRSRSTLRSTVSTSRGCSNVEARLFGPGQGPGRSHRGARPQSRRRPRLQPDRAHDDGGLLRPLDGELRPPGPRHRRRHRREARPGELGRGLRRPRTGSCWTTATSSSTSSRRRRAGSTRSSGSGATRRTRPVSFGAQSPTPLLDETGEQSSGRDSRIPWRTRDRRPSGRTSGRGTGRSRGRSRRSSARPTFRPRS